MLKTEKGQIIAISIATLVFLISLITTIRLTDPYSGNSYVFTSFYASLFLTSVGFFLLLGLPLRNWWNEKLYMTNLSHSFRQAILVSVFLVGSLVLQAKDLLYWWTEGSFVLLLVCFETFMNLKI